MSWYENGTQLGSSYQYASGSNPSIAAIEFGGYFTSSGTVSNLSLTSVPEPTSLTVLSLSAMGLLRRRRPTAA